MTAGAWHRTIRAILDDLDPGARIERSGRHLRITLSGGAPVFVSSTPSDWRTERNVRRDITRALRSAPRAPAAARDL